MLCCAGEGEGEGEGEELVYCTQLSMRGCSVVWLSYVCRMVDDRVVVNVNDGSPMNPPSKFRGEQVQYYSDSIECAQTLCMPSTGCRHTQ